MGLYKDDLGVYRVVYGYMGFGVSKNQAPLFSNPQNAVSSILGSTLGSPCLRKPRTLV